MNVRVKIFLLFVTFMLVSSLGTIYMNYTVSKDVLELQIDKAFVSLAEAKAEEVKLLLREEEEKLEILSNGVDYTTLLRVPQEDPVYKEAYESAVVQLQGGVISDFYELFILDPQGVIVASSTEHHAGDSISIPESYHEDGESIFFVSDAYFSVINQRKTLDVYMKLYDDDVFLGFLVGEVDFNTIDALMINRIGLGETGETYIVNQDGLMITPSRFLEDTFLKQKVDTVNANNCLEHLRMGVEDHSSDDSLGLNEELRFKDYRGVSVLGAHAHIPEMGWCVLAEIDEEEELKELQQELLKVSLFVLIGLIVLVGIFVFIADRILMNVNRTTTRKKASRSSA